MRVAFVVFSVLFLIVSAAVFVQSQSLYVPAASSGGAYVSISSTALTVVENHPGIFFGVYSPGGVQVNAMECWDSASTASGTVIYDKIASTTASDMPAMGIAVVNGIVCQQSVAITGNELIVFR